MKITCPTLVLPYLSTLINQACSLGLRHPVLGPGPRSTAAARKVNKGRGGGRRAGLAQ